jgi:uncharacterized protein YbjQ (UPF0145 family)
VPGVVLEAGASGGPCSSGMPSGPGFCAALAVDVVAVALWVVAEALDEAEALWELVLLELLPHAASRQLASNAVAVQRWRGGIALQRNGSEHGAMVSWARMSDVADLPMTTGFELPGARVRENLGICYGLVVRSMGLVGGMTSQIRALRRGEVPEYTQLLEDSRRHAIDRMSDNARLLGADAIIAVRFDSSEIGGQFTEIVAYGTAVKLDPT